MSPLDASQRQRLNTLASDRHWIDQAANLLLFGASGLGKSHIAAAVGHGLIEQGLRVRYYPASNLVQELQSAKQALALSDALAKLDKYRLLIIGKRPAKCSLPLSFIPADHDRLTDIEGDSSWVGSIVAGISGDGWLMAGKIVG